MSASKDLLFVAIGVVILIVIGLISSAIFGRKEQVPSRGAQKLEEELRRRQLRFTKEYPITINGRRYRYDFKVGNYLIEFDGAQHFEFIPFFHRNIEGFRDQQRRDQLKTQEALNQGFVLIRIADTDTNRIAFHLDQGFKQTSGVYVSSPNKYQYLNT